MISGLHLATALSVMLHMEQEGNGMETKTELLIGRLKNGGEAYEYSHNLRVVPEIYALEAADRLSEQQQVIDELMGALRELEDALDSGLCNSGIPGFDYGRLPRAQEAAKRIISQAKGHTKDAE